MSETWAEPVALDEPLARRPAWRHGMILNTPEDVARRAREAAQRGASPSQRIAELEAALALLTEQHQLDRGRLEAAMEAVVDLRRQLDQHLGEKWGHRP